MQRDLALIVSPSVDISFENLQFVQMLFWNLDKNILQCNTNALKRNLDKHIFAMQHTPSPPRGLPSLLQILRRRPRSESQLQLEASRPSDLTAVSLFLILSVSSVSRGPG